MAEENEILGSDKEIFRDIFDQSVMGEAVVDLKGMYVDVNERFCNIIGYSKRELIGKNISDITHPEDVKKTFDVLRDILSEKIHIAKLEKRYIRKDKKIIWGFLNIGLFRDKDDKPQYFIAKVQDITEFKEVEQKLRESERALSTVFDASPNLIAITRLSNGIILDVNEGYSQLLGFSRDESLGKTTAELSIWANPMDRKRFIDLLKKNGQVTGFETTLKRKDGKLVTVINSAKNFRFKDEDCILSVAYDITERKLLEKELLQASEDRYKAIFLASRDAIMTLEPPSWRFTSGNPATIEMFRTKNEGNFLTYEPWRLSPEFQPDGRDSVTKAKDMIEKAMQEGSNFFEWMHRRADGEDFFAEVLLSRVEQGGKAFLHAVVRDITERKKLEEKIKGYAEERFKVVFDNANDGMVLVNNITRKFLLVNNAFLRMLGYRLEETKNMTIADIHPKKELPYVLEKFEKQVKGEITLAEAIPVKRKDGSIFYADITASPVKISGETSLLGIFRDITERKLAEEKLKKSENKYSTLVEKASDGIVVVQDFLIKFANSKMLELTGHTTKEIQDKPFLSFIAPDYIDLIENNYKKRLAGKRVEPNYKVKIVKKNGQQLSVEVRGSMIDYEGKLADMVFLTDITEREKAEEEEKKRVVQIEKINRLAIGRELKMIELKKEIKELKEKIKNQQ